MILIPICLHYNAAVNLPISCLFLCDTNKFYSLVNISVAAFHICCNCWLSFEHFKLKISRFNHSKTLPYIYSECFTKPNQDTGAPGGAAGSDTALQAGWSQVRIPMDSFEYFIDIILPAGPGVESDSNRNGYYEYLVGGKGGRCVGLTTWPPSYADCLEIWEPQTSGSLRTCRGVWWDCFAS